MRAMELAKKVFIGDVPEHGEVVAHQLDTTDAVALRALLPGQSKAVEDKNRLQSAEAFRQLVEAEWGLSYDRDELRQAICSRVHNGSKKPCWDHSLRLTPIEQYSATVIPEDALLKWGAARGRSDQFSRFLVGDLQQVHRDPWLVGELREDMMPGRPSRYIVIAYWD